MPERILCVVEDVLRDYFAQMQRNSGLELVFYPPTRADDKESPATDTETLLEKYAADICEKVVADRFAALLIQAELFDSFVINQGVFLAELVWRKNVIPTVIAAFDLNAGQHAFSRRVRLPDGEPVLQIAQISQSNLPLDNPAPVLWDVLSDEKGFADAVKLSKQLSSETKDIPALQKKLINALIAERTATYRHRLGGLQASLRIMEGAYRKGWLAKADVLGMLYELEKGAEEKADELRAANLKFVRNTIIGFGPETSESLPSGVNELLIFVCDDDWKRSGWNYTIPRIIKKLFNIDVKGVESPSELAEKIKDERRKNRIVTILLDVHYQADEDAKTDETETITKEFLQSLKEEHPLLDVILFTSDLKLGWLVREAYRLDYRVFFKELDEQARFPVRDASEFADTIKSSLTAFPVRALQHLANGGVVDYEFTMAQKEDAVAEMFKTLKSWRQSANSASALALTPLLERQYRICREFITEEPDDPEEKNIWDDLNKSSKLNLDLPAAQIWEKIKNLATRSRNMLVHTPNVVLEANSVLPAIGLTIPLIIGINSLRQIYVNSSDDKLQDYLRNVSLIYDALYMSNQITRQDARNFLGEARKAFNSGQAKKEEALYDQIVEIIDNDTKDVFRLIKKTLKNKDAFFETEIKFGGSQRIRINRDALRLYRRICVLLSICLADFNSSKLKISEVPDDFE